MNWAQPHGVAPGVMGHRGRRPVVAVSEASIIVENTPLQRNCEAHDVVDVRYASANRTAPRLHRSGDRGECVRSDSPPYAVTACELREVVSKYWVVDDITPARLYGNMPDGFAGLPGVEFRAEANGRKSVPGWLLSAHLG